MTAGDHIYVRRPLGYTHHGVDCGDGTVIHFTGEPGRSKADASIARTPLEDFLGGSVLRVQRYGSRDDAAATMARANSKVGETGYHLVFNNCEHFARWCVTGRGVSEQVRGVGSLTAQGAVAGTTAAATGGVVAALGAVQGLSGAGIMSGLASAGGIVGAGAALGPAVLGAVPAAVAVAITRSALRDDESLPTDERDARLDGRRASVGGAVAGTLGGVTAIGAAGSVAGLSGAGIASGLATIGGMVGGGMAAGTAMVVAAPAVIAAGAALGVWQVSRRWRARAAATARRELEAGPPLDPDAPTSLS
jgi:hypothetical protein